MGRSAPISLEGEAETPYTARLVTYMLPPARWAPVAPHVDASQRGRGPLPLRYEDVLQDGRLTLRPMTHAIGAAIWRAALSSHPLLDAFRADAVLPILSRLVVEGGGGPLAVQTIVECEGAFDLTRCGDDHGQTRLRLDMFASLAGAVGRTHGSAPREAGAVIAIGRVYAEHVLTRPFAPAAQRKVSALPPAIALALRDARWTLPHVIAELPDDAEAIDDAYVADPSAIVFGLGHTDANQHVNSLVYPLLLEEAALRRFAALGLPLDRFAQAIDLGFRKPCFAGDRARILLRAFRDAGGLGVTAAFVPESHKGDAPGERALCYARMRFTE